MQATALTLSPEAFRAQDPASWPFTVRRSTPVIGAEVEGIDFREALDDATCLALRAALLAHKVLFFRKQAITPAQHVAIARRFGELEVHPMFTNHPEHPELVVFGRDGEKRGRENLYHSDVSWREIPSMGSMLRCITCPEVGGDTIWINMAAAYEKLPEDVKARIANLKAVHDAMPTFGAALSEEKYEDMRAKYPPMVHPVVRTHPETGEKILFVNEAFTTHFANFVKEQAYRIGSDYRPAELDLLQYLYRQAAAPEYQVRLRWEPDTIALWDNRSTQHYAVQDYFPAVRHMNRATIIGDRPV
ncbi:TauD/TfdA dioxygenase family protein [Cupriavidus consociatus]|uniref:TauD/TfdA dioxygenase family protein n=1 Tax=Cupriavidus consociatus TaxID=2821357 RepID=UPI001AEA4A30|nr:MULTISPECIES: TauD/TfdA family dioxygenase [unclassified Cupriavidus]MBP0619533.1 TauD/TfdA family dioxygenase [Cupriavidus sp. LEh25]MDK2656183.1 TauD/TfdA family dioxygenase [Cupriavidus sp. LEh21]